MEDVLKQYEQMNESKNIENRVSIDLNPNSWV